MKIENFLLKAIKERVNPENHEKLRSDLRKNRKAQSLKEHVARSIFYPTLISIILVPILYFLLNFFFDLTLIATVAASIALGVGIGLATNRAIIWYPRIRLSNRKKEINDMLPHATAYMLALSKGGYEPTEIFKSLSEQEEYGEIAKEASAVHRNSELLGYNPTEAMERVAETTPSQKFGDFLHSFISVIETGSNTIDFLSRKCEQFYNETEEEQEEDLEFIGVLSESYVASVGLGPIFGIVLLILFAMLERFQVSLLYGIVYVMIPVGTALFILLLDMQSRTAIAERTGTMNPVRNGISNGQSLKDGLKKPRRWMRETIEELIRDPKKILWASVPLAGITAIVLILYGLLIETALVVFTLVSLTPLTILHEIGEKREESMIDTMPDFLDSFSSSLNSGLSPTKSVRSLSTDRYPGLSSELKRIHSELEWGESVSDTFLRASQRIKSGLISRTMLLVKKSSEVASDLGDILSVLSRDVTMERNLKGERKRVTSTYVIIILLTFGIFLLTSYSMASAFIPLLAQTPAEPGEVGMEEIRIGGVDPQTIRMTFFRASLLQAFFSGLLAGKMRSEKILSGLKYSLVMLSIAWVFFLVTII